MTGKKNSIIDDLHDPYIKYTLGWYIKITAMFNSKLMLIAMRESKKNI